MSLNIADPIQQMLKRLHDAPVITAEIADHPTILGGRFQAEYLDMFLSIWRMRWQTMPLRIWEHISTIEFADEPAEPVYLERGDIFGEAGHLSLRRNETYWLWHYIGQPVQQTETFNLPGTCEDFWTTAQGKQARLHRYEERVLLWGEDRHNRGIWWEDRVAAARLHYPTPAGGRIQLVFWRFTEHGQTAFIWYRTLETLARNIQQYAEQETDDGTA